MGVLVFPHSSHSLAFILSISFVLLKYLIVFGTKSALDWNAFFCRLKHSHFLNSFGITELYSKIFSCSEFS
ncbi:hypothetical protein, partial [Coprococcus comes]|uniref:hypothetical protein n=1 Tax=Coprococcus comes TaxID=410072 RepID=UPI003D2BD7FD